MHLNTCYLNAQKLVRLWVSVKFNESNFLDKFVNHKNFQASIADRKRKNEVLKSILTAHF